MAGVGYFYRRIVDNNELEHMVLVPSIEIRLEYQVGVALRCLRFADLNAPKDFMEYMKEEFATVNSVYTHQINSKYEDMQIDPLIKRIRSLKPKRQKEVIRAFLRIAIEVIKRSGGSSGTLKSEKS